MISWIVKMLLFWHYQKLTQLGPGVKISYNILTPLDIFTPQQINDKVLFAFYINLVRWLCENYINDFLNSYNAFILTLPKANPTWPGVKISYNILIPPPRYFHSPTNQWQSFVCILYFLGKIIMLKWYQWFLE